MRTLVQQKHLNDIYFHQALRTEYRANINIRLCHYFIKINANAA